MQRFLSIILLVFFSLNVAAYKSKISHPQFPLLDGWLGSDLAYSIPLSDTQDLWLFGDSFIGTPGAKDRIDSSFISNSVGISTTDRSGNFDIKYYWNTTINKEPAAIFKHKNRSHGYLYWPKDAIIINGLLYVTLVEIHVYDMSSPMGFKEVSTKLATVENPLDAPTKWKVNYQNFTTISSVFPGSRFVHKGDYLYWFSTYKPLSNVSWMKTPMLLQRTPITSLDNLINKQQYFAEDQSWKPGLRLEDAKHIMDHGSTEMTIHYSKPHSKWVALYGEFPLGTDRAVIRVSEQLEGPWSDQISIFNYPEMNPKKPQYLIGSFGYAPKFHPQYTNPEKPYELKMTYVVNNEVGSRLLTRLNYYVPQVVTIKLPKEFKAIDDKQ